MTKAATATASAVYRLESSDESVSAMHGMVIVVGHVLMQRGMVYSVGRVEEDAHDIGGSVA